MSVSLACQCLWRVSVSGMSVSRHEPEALTCQCRLSSKLIYFSVHGITIGQAHARLIGCKYVIYNLCVQAFVPQYESLGHEL